MDSTRFDALARTVFAATTRRRALSLLLGAGFAGFGRDALGMKGKRRKPGSGNARAQRRHTGKHRKGSERKARATRAEAAGCCASGNCIPGKGKNLGKCCYQNQDLTGKTFQGANLGSANFSGATLTNANLQGANLGKACLVDATLTGAIINGATNLGGVIYCRTQTDSGENNAGCDKGTKCCPTCDDDHPCDDGDVCCNGRCVVGDCCDNGEQSTCTAGQLCCANTCAAGECCAAADCPNRSCRRRACQDNTCAHTPITGESGPGCQTICCSGACCPEGTSGCDAENQCGCRAGQDCEAGQVCCAGACRSGDCCGAQDCGSSGNSCADFRCACGAGPECSSPTPHCCGTAAQAICRECCTDSHCPNADEPFCLDFQCVDEDVVRTFERVRTVVANVLGVDEDRITMQTEFIRDLNADSLDVVELIIAVEDEFGITIEDEDAETIRTVADAVQYIVEHTG